MICNPNSPLIFVERHPACSVPWGWTRKHAFPGCKLLDQPFDREGNRFVELMACKPPV